MESIKSAIMLYLKKPCIYYNKLRSHYAALPEGRKRLFYWSIVPTGYCILIVSLLFLLDSLPFELPKLIDLSTMVTSIILLFIFSILYPFSFAMAALYFALYCRQGWQTSFIPLAIHAVYFSLLFKTEGALLLCSIYYIFINGPIVDL